MMINCPKCGFEQPQDRYCASCGIDMAAFRPAPTPLFRRLLQNSLFQFALILVIIAAAGTVIRQQRNDELKERVSAIENARDTRIIERRLDGNREEQTAESASEGTAAAKRLEAVAQAEPTTEEDEPQPIQAVAPAAVALAASAPVSASPPTESPTAPTASAEAADSAALVATSEVAPPRSVRLTFAEAQRGFVSDLLAEARNANSYGTFAAGVIPDLSQRLKTGQQNGAILPIRSEEDSVNTLPLRANQPAILFKGARDTSSDMAQSANLGLTLQVTASVIDETGVTLHVEVLRTLKDVPGSPPGVSEQTFAETFTIPRDGGAFLAGMLPHRMASDEETQRFYNNASILRVFNSPDFRNNASEFIIFVELAP